MKIQDRVFIVTGGANGLGGACVEAIVRDKGGKAVIFDIKEEDATNLVKKLGPNAFWPGQTDIVSEESVLKSIQAAVEKFGRIDGVVNAAGVGWVGRTLSKDGEPGDLESFRRVLEINTTGTYNVTRLVAAQIFKQKPTNEEEERGIVINVASVAAYEGQIGQIAYGASKGAVASMTLILARDLGSFGIRVNAIAPALFETPMTRYTPDKLSKSLVNQNEFPKRQGRPAEFAHMAVAIIENTFLNGAVIRLDAGARMARF